MEYTLDELARMVRAGAGEGFQALDNAMHDQGHIGAESLDWLVVKQGFERILKRQEARVRAQAFRVAHGSSQDEANRLAAGFGDLLEVVIRDVAVLGAHGFLSKGDSAEAVYVLKYLRKAVDVRLGR